MRRKLELRSKNSIYKGKYQLLLPIMGWALSITAFYPGFMSPDSLNQYSQALNKSFNDHHPVVMAVLWSEFNKLASGPFPMLIFQVTLYWLAVGIIYLKKIEKKNSTILVLLSFSPFILSILGVIWKDVHFATGLLLLVASSLDRRKFKIRTLNIIILTLEVLLILYIANVRGNSWLVILLIIYLWINSYLKTVTTLKKICASLILTIGLFGIGQYFTYQIVQAKPTYIVNDYLVDNLIYFSILEGESLISEVEYDDMIACVPATIAEMKLNLRFFCLNISGKYNTSSMNTDQLLDEFKQMVAKHPWAFIKYKLAAFSEFEGTFWHKNYYYWQTGGVDSNTLGIEQTDNFFTTLIKKYSDTFATFLPFVFSPLFWLWSSLVVVTLSWKRRNIDTDNVSLILAASAFLYNFQNILGAGGPDFRYFYWSAIATTFSLILLKLNMSNTFAHEIKSSSLSWKIFWVTLTLMFIFQVQIFHHVNYLDLI